MMMTMLRSSSVALAAIASVFVVPISGLGCGTSGVATGGASNTAAGKGGAPTNVGAGSDVGGSSAGVGPSTSGGNAASTSGASGNAGSSGNAAGGAATANGCAQPGLVWRSANKTNYTSYPEPGSEECVKFSGCLYEGLFAACDGKKSLAWVKSHNIVAAFPDLKTLELHDLCLKAGNKTIVVTVYDTCADSDCDGCCSQNKGDKDELIDIESFTNERWGVPDGPIQWADLGPTKGAGCE